MSRVETIGDCTRVRFSGEQGRVAIYAISGSYSSDVQYIGSTGELLKDRIRAHFLDARKGSDLPVHQFIRRNEQGFDVRVLQYVEPEHRVDAERHWIKLLAPPLNLTDGGPAMSGHHFAGSKHARRIAAALRSGEHRNCERCGAQFWRKLSEIRKGNSKYCSRVCSNARHKDLAHAA